MAAAVPSRAPKNSKLECSADESWRASAEYPRRSHGVAATLSAEYPRGIATRTELPHIEIITSRPLARVDVVVEQFDLGRAPLRLGLDVPRPSLVPLFLPPSDVGDAPRALRLAFFRELLFAFEVPAPRTLEVLPRRRRDPRTLEVLPRRRRCDPRTSEIAAASPRPADVGSERGISEPVDFRARRTRRN